MKGFQEHKDPEHIKMEAFFLDGVRYEREAIGSFLLKRRLSPEKVQI